MPRAAGNWAASRLSNVELEWKIARSPLPESPLPNALGIAADSLFFIAHSPPLGVGGRAIKKSYERIARPFSGNALKIISLEQRAFEPRA
ncbi:MAG: hypothetical protein EAZ51_03835 [Sphingobacteriales bacterium]|nr:MAG: hypothetical protein EAZ64_06715 [Sphingobacteriales bacterium]TAF81611.1 MAG: hypothetical protein EAZ51_03835 [Sphingobacteriales bacterium]